MKDEMNLQGFLLEMLLTGFFAVACMRARVEPIGDGAFRLTDLFAFRGRLERLQRTRWQWCSIALLLIVARIQWKLPLFVEITFLLMLIFFLAIPPRKDQA